MASAIDTARRAAILARAPMAPKGTCHFCGIRVAAKGVLWCAAWCAGEYEKERAEIFQPARV